MHIVVSSKRMETHNACNCVCLVVRGYCNCPGWGGGGGRVVRPLNAESSFSKSEE